jgi:hypothetical protein
MNQYKKIIENYGGDPYSFLGFDVDEDLIHLLPYATLTSARNTGGLSAIVGVYEWQNVPLFVLVDGETLGGKTDKLSQLRRLVAMRGDAPYIAVSRSGSLTFYEVGLDNALFDGTNVLSAEDKDLTAVIPYLINLRPTPASKQTWISDVILKLLTRALDGLVKLKINDGDAISLVGRALFTRFLADRGLLPDEVANSTKSGAKDLFSSHESVHAISTWLDQTFNGDFLPLSREKIHALPGEAFGLVGDILHRAEGGQLHLEWSEDWAKLDFAHIPVGVLSQAYERYLGLHQKERQRKEGSFYTPRHIADLMVHASFAALKREGKAHTAKVLDPAAGAGVFLITAFRQLVKERWNHDGKRPSTQVLREILYEQVRGFDINDSALRFAALGLYLMSIELDDAPKPVEKLRFAKDLRQTVIFLLGADNGRDGVKGLGSLGDEVGPEHNSSYDLVIGNPPWASATGLENWKSVKQRVATIARERLRDEDVEALLPNEVLDLPFVWRAMEWARAGGQIAFALHARLLFQRGEGMAKAFSAVCRSIDVTGIINGTEVRQSAVWPNVSAPFCVLFARNVRSGPGAAFRYVSPHLEGPLNEAGGWRIDPAQTETVSVESLETQPELLKVLFRGSRLDQEIFERLSAKKYPSFGEYWSRLHGGTANQPRCAGKGFGNLFKGSRPNPREDGLPGYSAESMYDLPVLEHHDFDGVLLDTSRFRLFRELNMPRLDQRRKMEIYKGPILLVRKSPSAENGRIHTSISLRDLAYNQTYYGYTAHKQNNSTDLVKYLCLVISSKISLWHALITSGGFGVERDPVEKFVIQEAPLPPFEELDESQRAYALDLFDGLSQGETTEKWQRVDTWVGSLFGLTSDDIEVISDTLAFALPFAVNRRAAQEPTTFQSRALYAKRLELELQPWGEKFNRKFNVNLMDVSPLSPWQFIVVRVGTDPGTDNHIDAGLRIAMESGANALSSSEIVHHDHKRDCLYLGRLNQARYWSSSQARLAARRVIWDHIDFVSGDSPQ